jgi:transcription antitermination factor NusG
MMTLTAYSTPPQKERKVRQELEHMGIPTRCPTHTIERRLSHHTKRTVRIEEPVARGYVFTDPRHSYERHTLDRIGVTIRRVGLALASDVDRLEVQPEPETTADTFSPGDVVRITDGPFRDHQGTIDRKRGEGYIVIVNLIAGKPCPIPFAESYLVAVA